MIPGLTTLAYYYPAGGDFFGNVLFQWEQAGVFSYVLPFLIIFAITFGILSKVKLFEQKGINVVIALASSLMALQFNLVSVFFSEIFPRMGVGLAVILVLIILMALFVPGDSMAFSWIMVLFGLIVFGSVLWNTFSAVGWNFGSGYWNYYSLNWGNILMAAVLVGAIVLIVAPELFKNKKKMSKPGTIFDAMLESARKSE